MAHMWVGVPNASEQATKSEVAPMWVGLPHHRCHVGGHRCFKAGDKGGSGPQVTGWATSPMTSRGSPTPDFPNSRKKMKRGATPKTPKRLSPAGCCHSSPLGTLDSGIAVNSYIGIQMCSSWTPGLQSIAQTCRQTRNNFRLFSPTNCVINRSGVHNSEQYLLACNVADNACQHICLVPRNRQTIPAANGPEFTQHPLMHGAILHRCGKCCIHIILKPS